MPSGDTVKPLAHANFLCRESKLTNRSGFSWRAQATWRMSIVRQSISRISHTGRGSDWPATAP